MDGGIFERIVGRLGNEEPGQGGRTLAAVSVILKERASPKVLLIKRAEREGDPWSGQVAFPGGKMEEGDASARAVAVRETLEEVGIDLDRSSEFLGYHVPVVTHTGTMTVVPAVYLLNREVTVKPNEEVSSYVWADLGKLLGPESRSSYLFAAGGQGVEMPAFAFEDYVVWGLTYRIVTSLAGLPGKAGPPRPNG